MASGAAIACPDRPVLNLQADGSALYTPQALWTQAGEGFDVRPIIFGNAACAIPGMELDRVGAAAPPDGPSRALLDLPGLDFVALAQGLGVPASRATTAEELVDHLGEALTEPGPHLIEAVLPPQNSLSGAAVQAQWATRKGQARHQAP